jgi:tetratricopeptide (TPR) repeat protein
VNGGASGGAPRGGRAARLEDIRALIRSSQPREALAMAEPLLRIDSRNPELLSIAARCRNALGQHHEAIALATRSLAIVDHPDPLMVRGDSLRALGRTDEAIADLRRAIRHEPSVDELRLALVATLEEAGRAGEARAELAPVLESLRGRAAGPGAPLPERAAYEHAKLLVREGAADEAVRTIDATLPLSRAGSTPFLMLLFLRAKALDRLGHFEDAWASAQRAHRSRTLSFDPAALSRSTDEAIAWWTEERVAEIGDSGLASELPVFVAGMPRSGTSLVDQIIDAHPDAKGVGELESVERWAEAAGLGAPPDHARVARAYVDEIHRLAPSAKRIVNKALGNTRVLGHLARLFPRTRIIHIGRDPRDVAVSCVLGAFGAERYPWTARPEWVAVAWRESERLMAHWKRVLRVPIHMLRYEDLATEGEPHMRQLLDFLGLPWSPHVLRFHASHRTVRTLSYDSVSRPLTAASIGRWRNYARALEGVDFPSYPARESGA